MSKRRNRKSRLTKTDVNAICELQRKVDAYEEYIMGLVGLIQHRGETKYIVLERGYEIDECVNTAWNNYMKQAVIIRKHEDELFDRKDEF